MNTYPTNLSARQATIQVLAVIGFVALVGAGMWLAVYSTRFVPSVVGRIGAAAVYLGSIFRSSEAPALSVVSTPAASTTLPFGDGSSTTSTTPVSKKPVAPAQPNWTPGAPVAIAGGTTTPSTPTAPHYSGLPDLAVSIETVGYMATDGSIIATTTIPARTQIAVKFFVTNTGTNVSGPWTMNISIPSGGTSANQTFSSLGSLVPTQPSGYIARFDNITPGAGRVISIVVDPNHQLTETSIANNVATSTSITVLGS